MTLGERLQASTNLLALTGGAVISQLPGIAYFYKITPPYYESFFLLATGGTLALFVYIYLSASSDAELARRGLRWIVVSLVVAAIYTPLYRAWTVPPPSGWPTNVRFQVGFGMANFSLSEKALIKSNELRIDNSSDLILAFGAYDDEKLSRVWKAWTIVTAGVSLVMIFTLAYASWVAGMAYLARALGMKADSNGPEPHRQEGEQDEI